MHPPVQFRSLTRDDFPLLSRWLEATHVTRWWQSHESVEKHYGPCLDGTDFTRLYFALAEGHPFGFLQAYRMDEYPQLANRLGINHGIGIDFLIGEPAYLNMGYGSTMLRTFAEKVVPQDFPDIPGILSDPSPENLVSIQTLRSAGFVPAEWSPEGIQYMIRQITPAEKSR